MKQSAVMKKRREARTLGVRIDRCGEGGIVFDMQASEDGELSYRFRGLVDDFEPVWAWVVGRIRTLGERSGVLDIRNVGGRGGVVELTREAFEQLRDSAYGRRGLSPEPVPAAASPPCLYLASHNYSVERGVV